MLDFLQKGPHSEWVVAPKLGEVHLDLCNVSFWLPICITPLGKSLNS